MPVISGITRAVVQDIIDKIKQKATAPAWNQDTDSLEAIREYLETYLDGVLTTVIDNIKQKATAPAWNQDTDSLEAIREAIDALTVGKGIALIQVHPIYVDGVDDLFALGLLAGEDYQPSTQDVQVETDFLNERFILGPINGTLKRLAWDELLRIYVDSDTGTYYYNTYLTLEKTTDFSTFTTILAETTIDTYSRSQVAIGAWRSEHLARALVTVDQILNNEVLVLKIRKTAYSNVTGGVSSHGFRSVTAKIALWIEGA